MSIIGYHASHEQLAPAELLQLVQLAEKAGFGAAMSSDHFNPWSLNQGSSGNAWSWLGAALQATKFNYASLAIPGGYRY
ncbi:MAG: LLM class flavin-dependent oxidoreductase, partial [Proteobacteria bacterium]